jgi:anti-anti-sigma factor
MPESAPRRPLHVKSRVEQGALVLTITEPHVRGDGMVNALRHELLAAVQDQHAPHVVLDFQPVATLASEAFRPLLSLRNKIREAGGQLVLCNLSPVVARAFQATRLVSTSRSSSATFDMQPDVATAVSRLRGTAAEE